MLTHEHERMRRATFLLLFAAGNGFEGSSSTMAVMRHLSLALRCPQQFLLKLAGRVERVAVARLKQRLCPELERANALRFLSRTFDCDAAEYLHAFRSSQFRKEFQANARLLRKRGLTQISSSHDCEFIFLTVRAAKPRIVVETGALYGAMSSHILEALRLNGGGELHSVDLPREADDPRPGFDALVPESLRKSHHLHLGDSLQVLPKLLRELDTIDMFNHDSLHMFEHMFAEYALAHQFLRPGGVLSSHDVLHTEGYPNAFSIFAESFGYQWTRCRNFGIARKPD